MTDANMTISQLILAAFAARKAGDYQEAARLDALRWCRAMGMVINSENTKKPKKQES